MNEHKEPENLRDLLDLLAAADGESGVVTFGEMLDVAGRRSFGPMLLLAGVIVLAPLIGDIPGVPTAVGVFVFLLAWQMLSGREHIWLPNWMLVRSVPRAKLRRAIDWLQPIARLVDRLLKSRLHVLVVGPARYAIAIVVMATSLLMPVMEFIPFSANVAGILLVVLGLALVARDGLMTLIAASLIALTAGVVGWNVF
ncbi:exopolysaccharide biosynthesis protein [Guyparkeria sp. 1SP6A2]|nr:exopolysaccharide biosynthesis protein [Guyparkeria sp. 1SP6A2]